MDRENIAAMEESLEIVKDVMAKGRQYGLTSYEAQIEVWVAFLKVYAFVEALASELDLPTAEAAGVVVHALGIKMFNLYKEVAKRQPPQELLAYYYDVGDTG